MIRGPASEKVTREELFALVWENPATAVAKDLGISDVALQKLCRRLQVPTPPRGYWAKVQAGKAPKRPNLEAFSEELDALRRTPPPGLVYLTAKQDEYLKRALDELAKAGTDTGECALAYREIRALSPDLAAKLILLVQNRHPTWLEDLPGISAQRGAERSITTLIQKLLPRAKSQVAVFQHDVSYRPENDLYPATAIRMSPSLQQKIACLRRVAQDHTLSHVALSLSTVEHAQFIRHIGPPDAHEQVEAELCISAHEAWIEGRIRHLFYEPHFKVEFTSERLPLQQLVPVDLLPNEDVRLPTAIRPIRIKPYKNRLEALRKAHQVLQELESAAVDAEQAIPDAKIAIMDGLLFGRHEGGPIYQMRQAWRQFENEYEQWERMLEVEETAICEDILGIRHGDDVIAESGRKTQRIHVTQMNVIVDESEVLFHIEGTRYRKDGTLGKRQEGIFLKAKQEYANSKK